MTMDNEKHEEVAGLNIDGLTENVDLREKKLAHQRKCHEKQVKKDIEKIQMCNGKYMKAYRHKTRRLKTEAELDQERERRQANSRMYRKRKLMEETEQERMKRLERNREYKRKLVERKTPEEMEALLKRSNEQKKTRRMNETSEQRQARLDKAKEYKRKWLQKKTPEELEAYKECLRQQYLNRKVNMVGVVKYSSPPTPEQQMRKRETTKRCRQRKIMMMSEVERDVWLAQKRLQKLGKRLRETNEEREERRERERQYTRRKRMGESEEQRVVRLERDRQARLRRKANRNSSGSDEFASGERQIIDNDNEASQTCKTPARPTKLVATRQIRRQLVENGELRRRRHHCSLRGGNATADDKLSLKAVVTLERIDVADFVRLFRPTSEATNDYELGGILVKAEMQ